MGRWIRRLLLAATLSPAAAPATVLAGDWSGPDSVMADAAGWYEYEFVLAVTEDSIQVAAVGFEGVENATGMFHGDCFCIPQTCVRRRGERWIVGVAGRLNDPARPGRAACWLDLCPTGGHEAVTTILPFDPTPVKSITWGRLRLLFAGSDELRVPSS